MQLMNCYYHIEMQLRYYGRIPESIRIDEHWVCGELGHTIVDVLRWKGPPHEFLANLRRNEEGLCEPQDVEAFVRRYGPLRGLTGVATSDFAENCHEFARLQEILRGAWRNDGESLEEIETQLEVLDVRSTTMEAGRFVLATSNLWTFLCFYFMRDFSAGKAKVCESPDCRNPYFIEQRGGQKYCSHVCAVRENVRRFRRIDFKARQQEVPRKSGRRRGHGATKTR